LSPGIDGLSGVVNAGMRKTVEVGGSVAGGAAMAGLTLATAGAGALASSATAAGTTASGAAKAGTMAKSMRALGTGASKAQAGLQQVSQRMGGGGGGGIGTDLMKQTSSAAGSIKGTMEQAVANKLDATIPTSKVGAGDRMAAAAMAKVGAADSAGSDAEAKAQWRGHGKEASNRDFGGGGAGGAGGGGGGGRPSPAAPASSPSQQVQDAKAAAAQGNHAAARDQLRNAQQGAAGSSDPKELQATAAQARDAGDQSSAAADAADKAGNPGEAAEHRATAAVAYATAATAEGARAQVASASPAASRTGRAQAASDMQRSQQQAGLATSEAAGGAGGAGGSGGSAASVSIAVSISAAQGAAVAAMAPSLRHGASLEDRGVQQRVLERIYAPRSDMTSTEIAEQRDRLRMAKKDHEFGAPLDQILVRTGGATAAQVQDACMHVLQEQVLANAHRHHELALMRTPNGLPSELPPVERHVAARHLEQISHLPSPTIEQLADRGKLVATLTEAVNPSLKSRLESTTSTIDPLIRDEASATLSHRGTGQPKVPLSRTSDVGVQSMGHLVGMLAEAERLPEGARNDSLRAVSAFAQLTAQRLQNAEASSDGGLVAQGLAFSIAARAARDASGAPDPVLQRAAGQSLQTFLSRLDSSTEPRMAIMQTHAVSLQETSDVAAVQQRVALLGEDEVKSTLGLLQKGEIMEDRSSVIAFMHTYHDGFHHAVGLERTAWSTTMGRNFENYPPHYAGEAEQALQAARAQPGDHDVAAQSVIADGRAAVFAAAAAGLGKGDVHQHLHEGRQFQDRMDSAYAALPAAQQAVVKSEIDQYRTFLRAHLPQDAV
jgi:hypothetical protein